MVEIVEEEPKSVVETIEETPFIEDQESLHNPLGLAMNVAMVVVAAAACFSQAFVFKMSSICASAKSHSSIRL